jgi:hypothetical protein
MRASLRALLAGIIDYAGLFPPAGLPLEQAVRNYARYRQEPESWMLGRFVCPAARLAELAPLLEEFAPSESPFPLSILGKGGNTTREFLGGLLDDLEAILSFRNTYGDRAAIEAYEVRLPRELLAFDNADDLRAVVHGTGGSLAQDGWLSVASCFEVSPDPDLRDRPDLLEQLAYLICALVEDRHRMKGFKLRCGGLEARAFPTPGEVACAIAMCRATCVPMKFTAGLHHPLRHFDAVLRTHVHGFLNVFGAGVLAHARRLSHEQIQTIIEGEDPGDFRFDDNGFRWKEWHATTEEIEIARQQTVISFGSCSFDDPRADLRALGLL